MYEEALDFMTAPRRLKRELPIPWVLEQEGIRLELRGSALVARCPFHPDSEPSFSVTDEGERGWRWGCWPCGISGDVVDLMRALYGIGFTDAVSAGIRGVAKMQASGWVAPVLEGRDPFNAPFARQLLAAARAAGGTVEDVLAFLQAKGMNIDPAWLVNTFDLSTLNGQMLVPIYSRNRELVGVKHRRLDASDHLFAFAGSDLQDVFYGEDRTAWAQWPVVLCEGESDVWTASWLLRQVPVQVLGLATGAGSLVKPAARLMRREVHIVFDGDDAGRTGAARWEAALVGYGCSVTVWDLPRGEDLTSYGNLDFLTRTLEGR